LATAPRAAWLQSWLQFARHPAKASYRPGLAASRPRRARRVGV